MSKKKIIFITGTDTGVGKTLLTALLLSHLRGNGVDAVAMKPFCSGGMEDVRLLQSLQKGVLKDIEMNPYYFNKPVAPLVAISEKPSKISLKQVVGKIHRLADRHEILLVEGSGGLMVPLGKGFDVGDLIAKLNCEVIVVCRNKLGTLNHTQLTLKALKTLGVMERRTKVAMMDGWQKDVSCTSNFEILQKLASKNESFQIPFLGKKAMQKTKIASKSKELAEILLKISGE